MSVESENLEAPNWLSELEKKRERRVKARLGHEAGAGAPCLNCSESCPGLDLHFWRKICKNCKCSKESHDVPDDDIYGWAQFQLLGSKPNKIKTTIVLPGRNEVELDWAPKGNEETIDKYLKTLPPESLPVKGSEAAQARKQLLQKQIPIHDIDPSLCHELTENEKIAMEKYIEHMKNNSVGVGQIIQFNTPTNSSLLCDRIPKTLPALETVTLQSERSSAPLTKHFESLGIKDQKELDAFFDKIPKPTNMANYLQNQQLEHATPKWGASNFAREHILNDPELNRNVPAAFGAPPLPNYAPNSLNIHQEQLNPQIPHEIKSVNYSAAPEINRNINASPQHYGDLANSNLRNFNPQLQNRVPEDVLQPNLVNIGAIHDITYNYDVQTAEPVENDFDFPPPPPIPEPDFVAADEKVCKKCKKPFEQNDFAVFAERSNDYFHSECFKCTGCNQNLADNLYFYDKESDNIYCGRDYAKIRGIPRCKACDELIFVKEYCLAENSTFHIKHFCCFQCDEALVGQKYIVEDSQPFCFTCTERMKCDRCQGCMQIIKPDEQGANLNGVHFHPTDKCFACKVCRKPLLKAKLLLRNNKLYCSHDCFHGDQTK